MAQQTPRVRRIARVRRAVRKPRRTAALRLCVFRSSKHIYAQVIDDAGGRDARRRLVARQGPAREAEDRRRQGRAAEVGKLIAERAVAAGVKDVVFDRGGYLYHGRVKALADAAREGGLKF